MKQIFLPGSKSISNRALVLAAISDQPTVLRGLLDSDDIRYMRGVLENFGVGSENVAEGLRVIPPKTLKGNDSDNFIGNAGTASRFTVALSLIVSGSFRLSGIPRMHERPFGDLMTAIEPTGMRIDTDNPGFLPATFTNPGLEHLETNEITIAGDISSQFITGLLLAAPRMPRGLVLNISTKIPSLPYVEMTLKMLDTWGVQYSLQKAEDGEQITQIKVSKGIRTPGTYTIPADMSAASIPMAWSLLKSEPICIQNFGVETLQGDEGFTAIIEKAGGTVRREGDKCFVDPGNSIQPLETVDFSTMPDVSMTGMVLAALGDGTSEFHGLESLRVKECDRIEAMVAGLKQLRIHTEVVEDVVTIDGNPDITANTLPEIHSFDDHRIAFCFAILLDALADTNVRQIHDSILEPQCVTKTWPNFWGDLAEWNDQLRPVSGVIVKQGDQYLIVEKPRKEHAWQFPQGGVDQGESGWQAAKRELVEECGSNLCVKFKGEQAVGAYRYLFPANFKRHDVGIVGAKVSFYLAEYIDGAVQVDGEEIIDYKWVKREELGEYFDAEYLESISNFLS